MTSESKYYELQNYILKNFPHSGNKVCGLKAKKELINDNEAKRQYKLTFTDGTIEFLYESYRWYDRDKEWYYHSIITHCDDGPAIIFSNGDKHYYNNNRLDRIDGPAIENVDGTYEYYQQGLLHNPNGPATFDGKNYEYWVCGTKFPDLKFFEKFYNEQILK